MKKVFLGLCVFLYAMVTQAQPPAVSGKLVLNLDLISHAGTGNYTLSNTWIDRSSSGNNVSQSNPALAPTLTTTASGFAALNFDASQGQFLSNTATTDLTNPEATIFVVREADPTTPSLTSISLISKDWNTDEMIMSSGVAGHHTWSGNFYYKDHPCYAGTPSNKPVVLTGVFRPGVSNSDLDFYVNNVLSSNTISSFGTPNSYYPVQRDIYIGRRILNAEYMHGKIMEILVYDKALSPTEIDLVNNYLKCKYNTNDYASAACNPSVSCLTPSGSCNDSCYWKLTGNNIIGGNNIFGTLSNDDILVKTNSLSRGTMTKDGRWSWNTILPSTTMHFYDDGSSMNRFSAPSGLRLENLPSGTGKTLVVDANGYVFVSNTQNRTQTEDASDIEKLKKEVALLKQQVILLTGSMSATPTENAAKLLVFPNPAKVKLNVTLVYGKQLSAGAFTVTDMQGITILTGSVPDNNKSFSVNTSSLVPGSYIISILDKGEMLGKASFIIE